MTKILVYDAEARRSLKSGVDKLTAAVKVTLGPKGRNVVIDKKFGAPTITKDGVTVAKEIELEDPFENMGAQMVREVASKTSDLAGDGTTTATVLAQAIINEGLKNVTAGANPMDLKRGVDWAVIKVIESLKKQSRDVGGKDVLSCEMMVRVVAHMLGHRRISVPMPISSTAVEAYVLSLVTPVPAPITMCLIRELRKSTPGDKTKIRRLVPFDPLSFRQAVLRAMSLEEQDRVHTRWSDAYPPAFDLALKLKDLEAAPEFTSVASVVSEKSASALFASACKIGGEAGWFHSNALWAIRGTLEWNEHHPHCPGGGECHCAHEELHTAVDAGEEAKG